MTFFYLLNIPNKKAPIIEWPFLLYPSKKK